MKGNLRKPLEPINLPIINSKIIVIFLQKSKRDCFTCLKVKDVGDIKLFWKTLKLLLYDKGSVYN